MRRADRETVISVVGTRMFQPIADLLGKLMKRPYQATDRVSSNYYEGGYSASAIVLLAAGIESLVQRDRYFFKRDNPSAKPSCIVAEYCQKVLKYRRYRRIAEIFEVRNAVAHNHLWEIQFSVPSSGGRQHAQSSIVKGTHRLKTKIKPSARVPRTSLLKVNLQPSRLDRTDVAKICGASVHFLDHLEKRGHNPIRFGAESVNCNGRRVGFSSLLTEVANAL